MIKYIKPLFLIVCFLFFVTIGNKANCQQIKKFSVEIMGSAFATSKKHFNFNTNEHIYYEARVGYRLNPYFETSLSVGYQLRDFLYFAELPQTNDQVLLFMERHYIPIAANMRLYISEFFYEKLKAWKKQDKWDVYLQVSLGTIKGNDVSDPREAVLRAQGAVAPFYKYPYVDVYDRLQVSYVGGVRLNLNKSIGVFIEGGQGQLMHGVIGLSARF